MKSKFTLLKSILKIVACILTVFAVTILILHKIQLNHQEQEELVSNQTIITNAPEPTEETKQVNEPRIINFYTVNRKLRDIITQYAKEHWDFEYTLNCYTDETVYSSSDIINISADKLVNEPGSIDMYCVPAQAREFIKGELSDYACTYRELGIDVNTATREADIPQYAINNGSNQEGELIALPYLSTVSVFVYRRSVAKEVWGTDDPVAIAGMIGGGSEKWDAFKQAALILKEHGYYIVPGYKDLIYSLRLNASTVIEEAISSELDDFIEVSKYLYDHGCIKETEAWSDQWFKDLNGVGDNVFGYFTLTDYYQYLNLQNTAGDWAICTPPYTVVSDYDSGILVNKNSQNKDIIGPFVEWLTLDSSQTGLQYQLASGTYKDEEKLSVLSGTVLKNADSSREFLGGQNINSIIYEALNNPFGQFDYVNNYISHLENAVDAYLWGGKDKAIIMEEFMATVSPNSQPGPVQDEDTILEWKNKDFERAIRVILKKPNSDIYLSDLSQITELHLEGKKLESLEGIEYFKNLTNLYCDTNELNDISSLRNLTKLEVLQLSCNQIKDISPLKDLLALKDINLNVNEIEDISSLGDLPELKTLNIATNHISEISSLSGLANLEALDLSKNSISMIDSLASLTKLHSLVLFDNEIRDIGSLKDLINLTDLYIDRNRISDISCLEDLTNLEVLSMSDNEISDIKSLRGMSKLNYLTLDDNKIIDISDLNNHKNLQYFEAKSNEIKEINIIGLNNLIHLDLSDNEIIDIDGLSELTNLDSLFLANNKITDISVLRKLKSLKSLSLVGNDIKDKSPAKNVMYVTWN